MQKIQFNPIGLLVYWTSFPIRILFFKSNYIKTNISPLMRVIHKSFIRTVSYPFLVFMFPIIFSLLISKVIGNPEIIIFSSGTYIPIITGFIVLSMAVINYRSSSLLKRIGATKISTWSLMIAFISYYFYCAFLSTLITIAMGLSIYYTTSPEYFNLEKIEYGFYFLGWLLGAILAFSIGILIAGFAKHESTAMAIGLVVAMPGAFLSGQFFPLPMINAVTVLRYFSWIFPQRGPALLANIAIAGDNPFSIKYHYTIDPNFYANLNLYLKIIHANAADPSVIWNALHNVFGDVFSKSFPQAGFAHNFNVNEFSWHFTSWFNQYSQVEMCRTWENILAFAMPLTSIATMTLLCVKTFRWSSR